MFCRCARRLRRRREHADVPGLPRLPGRAAGGEPDRAIEWTIKLGLALGCEIAEQAVFARKNYFYPDLPKGYQISQYDLPSCINGKVLVPTADGDREIGIVRAHLEEDAAKTTHVGGRTGRIGGADCLARRLQPRRHAARRDRHRRRTSTRPTRRSRFLQLLRQTIVELGISDAEMEKGTLRVDANVSVRPAGSDELRTRCELKNMNSFSFIARGIEAEVRAADRRLRVGRRGRCSRPTTSTPAPAR
mgnify:CR=1 FL=1